MNLLMKRFSIWRVAYMFVWYIIYMWKEKEGKSWRMQSMTDEVNELILMSSVSVCGIFLPWSIDFEVEKFIFGKFELNKKLMKF